MIGAGRRDRRITILQPNPGAGRDAAGEPVEDLVPLATVWAEKKHVEASARLAETYRTAEYAGQVETVFTILYRGDVTSKMVVRDDDGRLCDIAGLAEIGRREGLRLITWARTEQPRT